MVYRLLLIVIVGLLTLVSHAQSIIKPKKGDEIKAQIISTSGAYVEYKLYYFQEGDAFKIAKTEVLYIQYPDGRRETFEETPAPLTALTNAPVNALSADMAKGLEQMNKQLTEINKGQEVQTKTLNETLTNLNTTITALKTTIEQGNTESKLRAEQTNAKLDTLNKYFKSFAAVEHTKVGNEANNIMPRKFGMGVSFVTNYMLAGFNDEDGESVLADKQYNPLFFGAGFNMVISTRMDKKVGFRYEPEFSVASSFTRSKSNSNVETTRRSIFSFGSRFLAVARRNRVNIYAGPSLTIFGVVTVNRLNNESSSIARAGAGFGLHFGGEYLVHSNFGINIESGMQLYGLFPSGGYAEGIFSTYARLGGRFYF